MFCNFWSKDVYDININGYYTNLPLYVGVEENETNIDENNTNI